MQGCKSCLTTSILPELARKYGKEIMSPNSICFCQTQFFYVGGDFYVPTFLLTSVACSSSRILSATDHGANTFQNTHCRGGVRVAIATKRPKKVYQMRKARWLPATNNLERLKCKLLERMYIYLYIYIYIIYV